MRVVKFIAGELFRARVQSEEHPLTSYLVDLEAVDWNGECGCPDYGTKRRKNLKRFGPRRAACRCKHIEWARAAWLDEHGPLLADMMRTHQRQIMLMFEVAKLRLKENKWKRRDEDGP